MEKLHNVESKDRKKFWDVIKQITDDTRDISHQLFGPEHDDLVRQSLEYFTKLHNMGSDNSADNSCDTLLKSFSNGKYGDS